MGSHWSMLATNGCQSTESAHHPSATRPVPADTLSPGSQPQPHSFSDDQQGLTRDDLPATRHTRGTDTAPDTTTTLAPDQHAAFLSGPNPSLPQTTAHCSSSASRVQEQMPMSWHSKATHGNASAGPLQACQPSQAAQSPQRVSAAAPIKALALCGLHPSTAFAANAGLSWSHDSVDGDENADPASLGGRMGPLEMSEGGLPGSSCPGQVAAAGLQTWGPAERVYRSPSEASSDEDLAAHEDPACSGKTGIPSLAHGLDGKGTSTRGCPCKMLFVYCTGASRIL